MEIIKWRRFELRSNYYLSDDEPVAKMGHPISHVGHPSTSLVRVYDWALPGHDSQDENDEDFPCSS
jgi:hypothetical protein